MGNFAFSRVSLIGYVVLLGLLGAAYIAAAVGSDVYIDGIVSGCGDSVVDVGESCDGSNVNGQSCTTLGFNGGSLTCTQACSFDTSACTLSSSGGSGGGGGSRTQGAKSLLAFNGFTIPFGDITLLIDGVSVATTTADQIGRFRFAARNLVPGVYQTGLYVEDKDNIRSGTVSFSTQIRSRSVVKFDDIILIPTLTSDYAEVVQGRPVIFHGYGLPSSMVTFLLHASGTSVAIYQATTSPLGYYTFTQNTQDLVPETYIGTVRNNLYGMSSGSSSPVTVIVGTKTRERDGKECFVRGDLNKDCKVNLVDFSILIYWFKNQLSPEAILLEKETLSGDGRMNIVDFSIMLHYWTG